MQLYTNSVQDRFGNALKGAQITVRTSVGAVAVIYSDNGVTMASNPLTADATGEFAFYAANGRYTFTVTASGMQAEIVSAFEMQDALELQTAVTVGAVQVAADRVQTALDRVATGQDKVATAADRVITTQDKAATAADRVQTALDRAQTALDRTAAAGSAGGSASSAAASLTSANNSATSATTAGTNAAASANAQIAPSLAAAASSAAASLSIYGNTVNMQAAVALSTANANTATTQNTASGVSASASQASATASSAARDLSIAAWVASTAPTETLAAMSQSLHVGTVVKAIIYDTSKDSDSGAWRKRCSDKSWFTETLGGNRSVGQRASVSAAWTAAGSTTGAIYQSTVDGKYYAPTSATTQTEVFRGIVSEFPAKVAIVAETARVVIYDLSTGAMWMVFIQTVITDGTFGDFWRSGRSLGSVGVGGGCLYLAQSSGTSPSGLGMCNFLSDKLSKTALDVARGTGDNVAMRNSNSQKPCVAEPRITILSNTVNDVALTVLEGAPIDPATGMPVPTIAVATAGGLSTITNSGAVVNSTATTSVVSVDFDGPMLKAIRSDGVVAIYNNVATLTNAPSTTLSASTIPAIMGTATKGTVRTKGSSTGVTRIQRNPAVNTSSMVAHITNAYNSGWQVGDSRLATLADTVAETITSANPQSDRSVKNNPLSVVGSLTKTAVATGAQLVSYSGFSAANYLEQPYSANLDYSTTGFSGVFWLKEAPNSAIEYLINRGSVVPAQAIRMWVSVAGFLVFEVTDGTTTHTATGTVIVDDNTWKCVMFSFLSGTLNVYVNDILSATATGAALLTLNNSTALLRLGESGAGGAPLTNGSMALVRLSATVMSIDQRSQIYREELALFAPGVQCTIAGTSTAVTALAYDESTDLLHVGTGWGRSDFKGLLRTASEATTTGPITSLSASQGVILTGGTSAKVWQPALLLRDEIARKEEARKALGKVPVFIDFTATASQTAFVLAKGYTIKALYRNGTLMRETTTGVFWTRSHDGYQETATLSVGATVGDWISLMCVRSN